MIKSKYHFSGLILCLLLVLMSCGYGWSAEKEGLEIYLIDGNFRICKDFENIKLPSTPLIRSDDIMSYDWKENEIILKDSCWENIRKEFSIKKIGVALPFVLSIDRKPIYCGIIWSRYSSLLPTTPVILPEYFEEKKFIISQWEKDEKTKSPEIYDYLLKHNLLRDGGQPVTRDKE